MKDLINNVKTQAKIKVHKLLDENIAVHNKWDMYSEIFAEMDKRRITLKEICVIAESLNIPSAIIEMRRRDIQQMPGNKET